MKKRRNHTTFFDKAVNRLFRLRTLYKLFLLFLLISYPSSVIDGMRQEIETNVEIRLPLKYNTHGIDVSHHNGMVDWQKVFTFKEHHSAVQFCFAKATEGTDMIDSRFEVNWNELGEYNVRRGAYHFFNPATDARLQALNYILNVKLEDGDIAPVLDWETLGRGKNRRDIVKNVNIWLEVIEKHYGIKPIIYTNKSIYHAYIKEYFGNYPLWISNYNVPELKGMDLSQVYFWQHSVDGQVEGIETLVDFNAFIREDSEIGAITFRL